MSLPHDWEQAALSHIADVTMGQSPDSHTYNDSGEGLPFFQGKAEFGEDYPTIKKWCSAPGKLADAGDILLSIRAPVGPTNLAREQSCIGRGLAAIKAVEPIPNRYVLHYFRSVEPWLSQQGTGTTFKAISGDFVRNLQVPVAPLNEQRRIVAKLDALFERSRNIRDKLDRIPTLLDKLRKSILAAAFRGDLTREWREQNGTRDAARNLAAVLRAAHEEAGGHKKGNAATPTDGVHSLAQSELPGTWEILELRDLCTPDKPICYGILKPGPELDAGVPYVRVADFPNDSLNLATVRKTSAAIDQQFARSRLSPGDLLLSIRGTVGRMCVAPPELNGANITQDSARLSIQGLVNPDYVRLYLKSPEAQRRMAAATKGVAIRGINIGDVRALQVPIPEKREQDRIAAELSEILKRIDAMLALCTSLKKRVATFRSSSLDMAFRGELVPQDPADEPASALLERIRAERSMQPVTKRTRKIKTTTRTV